MSAWLPEARRRLRDGLDVCWSAWNGTTLHQSPQIPGSGDFLPIFLPKQAARWSWRGCISWSQPITGVPGQGASPASQADSAGSIPVTRSRVRIQVRTTVSASGPCWFTVVGAFRAINVQLARAWSAAIACGRLGGRPASYRTTCARPMHRAASFEPARTRRASNRTPKLATWWGWSPSSSRAWSQSGRTSPVAGSR
jgi:hypothetical protein